MSVIHAPKRPTVDIRMLVFPFAVALALVVIFLRLWFFQVVRGSELIEEASHTRERTFATMAPRGLIFDRSGKMIAGVKSVFVVTAIPSIVEKNPGVLDKLSSMLGVPADKLAAKLRRSLPGDPATIYVNVPVDVATVIAEGADTDLPGVSIESQPMRFYPDSKTFSQVLGYVSNASAEDVKRLAKEGLEAPPYVGQQGVERVYEKDLMGEPGAARFEVDAKRRPIRLIEPANPVPGDHVVVSIDSDLQRYALDSFLQHADASGSTKGAAVAIDPRNGEIICMVSSPTFDAGLFEQGITPDDWDAIKNDPTSPLLNRTMSAYPPGSTFKIITSLAALKKGTLALDHQVFCDGYYQVGKKKFKCEGHHGWISFSRAFYESCNTYFSDLGVHTGAKAISDMAHECGLGQRSDVDTTAEQRGLVADPTAKSPDGQQATWYEGDTVNMSVGQGKVAVTPLQMADLAELVANNGIQYRPHLVRKIVNADGEARYTPNEIAHQVEAPEWFWHTLKQAMLDVVAKGTGQHAQIKGIVWGGKTGSAEHLGQRKTHSWFIGVAPMDHPQIVIAVLVEDAGGGGYVAAPIAADIVHHYLVTERSPAAAVNASAHLAASAASAARPAAR
jgi:penicillin-binding protein 2